MLSRIVFATPDSCGLVCVTKRLISMRQDMAITYAAAREAPLLEYDHERHLIRDWQENGNRKSLETLILAHARLVFSWAHKLGRTKSDQEELISEGLLGLIKAAEVFDLGRDVRFSTYARWWIKNGVFSAFSRLNSVVDVPSQARHQNGQEQETILSENSYEGLEENEVEKFLCLDPTPEERLIERSNNDRMRQCIAEAMRDLCEIEREIVLSRNLRAQPDTVEELSLRLGISRERLRQVERRALSKLKYELLSRGISSILA